MEVRYHKQSFLLYFELVQVKSAKWLTIELQNKQKQEECVNRWLIGKTLHILGTNGQTVVIIKKMFTLFVS